MTALWMGMGMGMLIWEVGKGRMIRELGKEVGSGVSLDGREVCDVLDARVGFCFAALIDFGVWFCLAWEWVGIGWWSLFAKKSIRRASGLYTTISGKGENKIGCALRSFVIYIWIREWKGHNIRGFFSLRLGQDGMYVLYYHAFLPVCCCCCLQLIDKRMLFHCSVDLSRVS